MNSTSPGKKTWFLTLLLIILLVAGYLHVYYPQEKTPSSSQIMEAYTHGRSNVQVEGGGKIIKILKDDLQGSRHQKFIVQINSDLTVLIIHNIDLAPRLDSLRIGDQLFFHGEYEWNKKGGVVHWTHHDPHKQHPGGWLKYQGRIYR